MTKYKFSKPPWSYNDMYVDDSEGYTALIVQFNERKEQGRANLNLLLLAPALHEVVTKCQAILSNYLEPEGKSKEDVIKEFLDILDNKELVVKLKELEIC